MARNNFNKGLQIRKLFKVLGKVLPILSYQGYQSITRRGLLKSTPLQSVRNISFCDHDIQRTTIDGAQEAKVNINLHYSSCGKVTNVGIYVRLQSEELCGSRRQAWSSSFTIIAQIQSQCHFFIHAFVHNTNSHFSMQMHTRKKTDN